MEKKRIILLNYYPDTTAKLIDDSIKRGIEPILFISKSFGPFNRKMNIRVIHEKPKYKDTIKLLKSLHPIAILTRNEEDVELSSRLQHDLNLKYSNDPRYLKEQTCKDKMHEAVKKAGLRYMRGGVAHNPNEAVKIYRKLKCKKVIVKAPRAASCNTLQHCSNEKEVYNAAKGFFKNGANLTINKSSRELLIQEFIEGEEYFINTTSLNGHHKIMQIWGYHLAFFKDRSYFLNSDSLSKIDKKILRVCKYVKDVLNAIHFKNGPVHTEVFVDDKGPVLIEVNCRFAGGEFGMKLCDAIFGNHDTDIVIDSLLFPNEFLKHVDEMFPIYKRGYLEIVSSPRNCTVRSRPILNIIKRLPSFLDANITIEGTRHLKEQTGYASHCGLMHLLHEDAKVADQDSRFFEDIQLHYFGLLFEDVNHSHEDMPARVEKGRTLDNNVSDIVSTGLTLILDDKNEQNVPFANVTDLKHVNKQLDNYANGIINLKKNYDHLLREDIVESTLLFMEKIRCGGKIYISERSANLFPYGFDGYKMLLKLTNFKVLKTSDKYLVGVKTR